MECTGTCGNCVTCLRADLRGANATSKKLYAGVGRLRGALQEITAFVGRLRGGDRPGSTEVFVHWNRARGALDPEQATRDDLPAMLKAYTASKGDEPQGVRYHCPGGCACDDRPTTTPQPKLDGVRNAALEKAAGKAITSTGQGNT